MVNALRFSQVEGVCLLLSNRHRDLFLVLNSRTHKNVPADIMVVRLVDAESGRDNTLADFGIIVTPVTFERESRLIPVVTVLYTARRIRLVEVAQNRRLLFFTILVFLEDWQLSDGVFITALWWHEVLVSVLTDRREDARLWFDRWVLRMSPRGIKDFLGMGQDRRHIRIWTGKFDLLLLDQLLLD